MLQSRRSELILAGVLVWSILSIGVFIILLLPFVVPQHQLAQLPIAECVWQARFHKPCVFCGMTTAFYAISSGDLAQAHRLNPLSLYIYAIFLLNTVCVVISIKRAALFVKNIGATIRRHNIFS